MEGAWTGAPPLTLGSVDVRTVVLYLDALGRIEGLVGAFTDPR